MNHISATALRSLSSGTLSKLLRDACQQYGVPEPDTSRYTVLDAFHLRIIEAADARWTASNRPTAWNTIFADVLPDIMRTYCGANILTVEMEG